MLDTSSDTIAWLNPQDTEGDLRVDNAQSPHIDNADMWYQVGLEREANGEYKVCFDDEGEKDRYSYTKKCEHI